MVTKADLSQLFDTKLAEAVAKASHDGYMRGRREAEDEGGEKWIPPVDPKLVAKAKALEYIALSEIKRSKALQSRVKQKPKEVNLNPGIKLLLDDEAENAEGTIKWLEFVALFVDLLDLYLNHGHHVEKTPEMLNHFRLLLTFGNSQIFTYDSIMDYDTHIRQRKEGQGENLSWRFDPTTRHVILKDFNSKEKTKGKRQTKVSNSPTKKKRDESGNGLCHSWFKGQECKFGDACKFNHTCTTCGILKPSKHDLSKCNNPDPGLQKLKKPKPSQA